VKPGGLLTAVALLAVLGGLVWWSNKKQAAAGKSPADSTIKLLTIPDADFKEIRIKKVSGESIDLKREDGKWAMTEPKPLRADQDEVGSMVSNLSSLSADKLIEDKANDLKAYGLGDPTLNVEIVKKDGKTAGVLIGDDTPTGSGAYAKLPNDPRVFTVASFVKSSLDKRPEDLRDKRLLTFDSEKLTRIELDNKGQTVEFGKNGNNEWQIVKPRPLRADNSAVDTLIGKLKDAKMDPLNPDADAAKKFNASPRGVRISVTDAAGTQTMEVRQDKDKNYYAKSSVVEGVYKVGSDIGDGLNKTADDLRNKKLFDFGFSDPSKVEVDGVTYVKSADKWMSNGKTMDNISVQNLIDQLRDLSATGFPEKGAGDVVFTATVTSNNGKRVEKVTVRQQGTNYFAQREGEPAIYQLDPNSVKTVRDAAKNVKEAAPPAKKK
jgi:hypothetical protein